MTEASSEPVAFEPGDIVQLKSLGPAMTVIAIGADGVHLLWYAESNDEVKTDVLPAICLEKITILDDEDDEEDDEDEGKSRRGKKRRRDDD